MKYMKNQDFKAEKLITKLFPGEETETKKDLKRLLLLLCNYNNKKPSEIALWLPSYEIEELIRDAFSIVKSARAASTPQRRAIYVIAGEFVREES